MVDPAPLVIPATEIAAQIGLTSGLTPGQTAVIEAAIRNVQADVEGYLGAPVTPRTVAYTTSTWLDEGYVRDRWIPLVTWDVSSQTATTVTYAITYGYDAANDPDMAPVRRYIAYQAAQQPGVRAMWTQVVGVDAARRVKNASVEGQSVGYDYLSPTGDVLPSTNQYGRSAAEPTGVPTLSGLDYWRIAGRRAFQAKGPGSDPWSSAGVPSVYYPPYQGF